MVITIILKGVGIYRIAYRDQFLIAITILISCHHDEFHVTRFENPQNCLDCFLRNASPEQQ